LDLSTNTALTKLHCQDNQLTSLDVRNGNNANISEFVAVRNPNLTCIFVDDAAWSTANWTSIDPTSTFVETQEECEALDVEEVDNFTNFIIYPNPTKGSFNIQTENRIKDVKIYDVFGNLVGMFIKEKNYNISNLAKGIYFVYVKTDKGIMVSKLIIK